MNDKLYYIISLKHTSKGDTALTFWAHDSNGYTWHRDRAGLYTEDEIKECVSYNNVAVEKEKVDPFWMNAVDFNDKYISVPNTEQIHYALNIDSKRMKPKKFAGCKMQFINTPVTPQ